MTFKGYIYHIVQIRDVNSEVAILESISIINEVLNVFFDDFLRVSPEGKLTLV